MKEEMRVKLADKDHEIAALKEEYTMVKMAEKDREMAAFKEEIYSEIARLKGAISDNSKYLPGSPGRKHTVLECSASLSI